MIRCHEEYLILLDVPAEELTDVDTPQALEALKFFAKNEGIIAALESSHALSGALKIAKKVKNKKIIINVSGRGDKDIFITAKALQKGRWCEFLQNEIVEMKG